MRVNTISRILIGLEVFDAKDNSPVGVLEDVIQNTAQDIYLVKTKKDLRFLFQLLRNSSKI